MDEDEEHGEDEKIETNENGDLVLNKTTSSKYKVSVLG
jgi:hypothetical protein